MNTENYMEFMKAIGHRIISSSSGYWLDVNKSFFECIPPFQVISPSQSEVTALFRQHYLIGLKYCAPPDHNGKPSWIYTCENKEYDLKAVHPKMRNKIRQGMRNCTVRPIGFDYLYDHGMALNQDTLKRQNRQDAMFSEMNRWARLCQAGKEAEGAGVWGAFVKDQLAAYMITFRINEYANILHQMSKTELLGSHANNVLGFVATREMLASPGIKTVSYGQASIRRLPGLEEYKVRLGYKKESMRYVVVIHPLLEPIILSEFGKKILSKLKRYRPEHDILKQISGIVDIATHSKAVDLGTKMPATKPYFLLKKNKTLKGKMTECCHHKIKSIAEQKS
jgi:hypothetical protein